MHTHTYVQAERKHLDKLFDAFDPKGSGAVNLEELKAALRTKQLKKGGEKVYTYM